MKLDELFWGRESKVQSGSGSGREVEFLNISFLNRHDK